MAKKPSDDYKDPDYKEVAKELNVDLKKGLSSDVANKRLKLYGYNEIKEKETPTWLKFLKKFWGPIPWLIETAAILSAVLQRWDDFIIIFSLLLTNVLIDFMQERKAESAIKALESKLQVKAKVLRNGKIVEIPARLLVPGDIIVLRIGDMVPADVKLFSGDYLLVDQAALTGESLPVTKKVNDLAYAGTIIKKGRMYGIVVNTGFATKFGKSASLIKKAEVNQTGHLHRMVVKITNYLILLTIFLVITVFFVSIFRGGNIIEFIRFALVLTIASIPVALPAVLSVTMAVGALNLAKKKAIVRHLSAIQELASIDTLCVDKTGTLTKNALVVSDPISYNKYSKQDAIFYAILASKPEEKDPIDLAIYAARTKFKIKDSQLKAYKQTSFLPFDPKIKRTEADIVKGKTKFKVSKGAPQVIIAMTHLKGKVKEAVEKDVNDLARRGYRTLGVAVNKKGKWEFIGLIPLYDPPRDDAANTVSLIRDMGVNIKMVTGDNKAIAKEIARILGIGDKIYTTQELTNTDKQELMYLAKILSKEIYKKLKKKVSDAKAEEFSDQIVADIIKEFDNKKLPKGIVRKNKKQIAELIESADGFAEVYPEDKFDIVDSLQARGHIVGMTGDGVNDAPALKKADCGIAVDKATDAARMAADLVLTLPGIKVIYDAIVESRKIFKRMNTYVIYRITETIRVLFFMSFSIIFFNVYPVTPIMLVILALLNDIPIMMISYDNASVSKIAEKWNIPNILTLASILGLTGVFASFLLYYIAVVVWKLPFAVSSSMIFLNLVVAGHMTLYLARHTKSFWEKPYPSWKLLLTLETTQLFATLFVVYGIFVTPIGWKLAGIVWGYAFLWFLILDRIKVWTFKMIDKKKLGQSGVLSKL